MQRFAKKSFWEAKNRKMKTLEIRHSRVQNSGNAAFCEKKTFWEAKNRKMKTLEIRHSRVQNSGNGKFWEKRACRNIKTEKVKILIKNITKSRIAECHCETNESEWMSAN